MKALSYSGITTGSLILSTLWPEQVCGGDGSLLVLPTYLFRFSLALLKIATGSELGSYSRRNHIQTMDRESCL